jgi:hypothetical protein
MLKEFKNWIDQFIKVFVAKLTKEYQDPLPHHHHLQIHQIHHLLQMFHL